MTGPILSIHPFGLTNVMTLYYYDNRQKCKADNLTKNIYPGFSLLKSKPGFSLESQTGHDIGENIVETLQHHLFGCLLGPL